MRGDKKRTAQDDQAVRLRAPARASSHLQDMLYQAAEELSRLIETGRVERGLRSEARRLVMEAWLAAGSVHRASKTSARKTATSLREILRSVDRIISAPGGEPPRTPALLHVGSRPTMIDVWGGGSGPNLKCGAVARILARESAVAVMVRRTESMIEHALKTLDQTRQGARRQDFPSGSREALELVWGETEG